MRRPEILYMEFGSQHVMWDVKLTTAVLVIRDPACCSKCHNQTEVNNHSTHEYHISEVVDGTALVTPNTRAMGRLCASLIYLESSEFGRMNHDIIKIISSNVPGQTEKKHEKLHKDS
jgi:hypothetical protein